MHLPGVWKRKAQRGQTYHDEVSEKTIRGGKRELQKENGSEQGNAQGLETEADG